MAWGWTVSGWTLGVVGHTANFIEADFLLGARKVVIGWQEKHTVTLLALAHGDTGAIPVGRCGLSLFVFVMAAGAKGGTQIVFMFGQTLNDNRRHAGIDTKIGACALGVALREAAH